MKKQYNKEELKKAREFAEKHPKYHKFLMKHPWLPGLYMIIAGALFILVWYFRLGQDTPLFILRKISAISHWIGLAASIWGVYHIIKYITNPKKVNKEFSDWEKQVFNK